jgi:hypothetical protein
VLRVFDEPTETATRAVDADDEVRRHLADALRLARMVVGNTTTAEDIASEAVARLLIARRARRVDAPEAYLRRIVAAPPWASHPWQDRGVGMPLRLMDAAVLRNGSQILVVDGYGGVLDWEIADLRVSLGELGFRRSEMTNAGRTRLRAADGR